MARPTRREPYRVFFRESNKRWVVEYGHGKERGQKLVPKDIKGKEAAKRWAAENYGKGEAVPVKRDVDSVSALYDKFIEARRAEVRRPDSRFSPSTVKANESHGRKWIKPKLGDQPAQDVGHAELRQFIRDMRDDGAGVQMVRNVYYSVVAFFDEAMGENWVQLTTNPARHPGVLKEVPAPTDRRGGEKVITMPLEHAQALVIGRLPDGTRLPLRRRASYVLEVTLGTRAGRGLGSRSETSTSSRRPSEWSVSWGSTRRRRGSASSSESRSAARSAFCPCTPPLRPLYEVARRVGDLRGAEAAPVGPSLPEPEGACHPQPSG